MDTPPPRAGQEHLPYFTPRPGPDTPLDGEVDHDGTLHLCRCPGHRRMSWAATISAREPVTAARLAADGGQVCRCRQLGQLLAETFADPDRRMALVGWSRTRSTVDHGLPLLEQLARAGPCSLAGPDDDAPYAAAALALPLARELRDLAHVTRLPYLELVRVRTVDAAELVAPTAALWAPTDPDAVGHHFEDAVAAARRLHRARR
jgi:hypothetical protein